MESPTQTDTEPETVTTHGEWLARRPFTLALSAGFFGFFAHTGLLLALERAGLRPRRVTGVSAGALAGGLWAAGLSATALSTELRALRRPDFWDPGLPLGGLLRGRKFARKLDDLLGGPGREIADCRIPFAAVAYDVMMRRTVVVENGPLATAIQASCTVPLMFRPRVVRLSRPAATGLRGRWRLLVDGGVRDRNGETALTGDDRVFMHALPSKSPWRNLPGLKNRAYGDTLDTRPTATRSTLTIPELPQVSPFHLERGQQAMDMAYERTRRWLETLR